MPDSVPEGSGISETPDSGPVADVRPASFRPDSANTIPISQLCLPEWPWVRQIAVFIGIPIAEGLFEKRRRAVWFVNIETGRLVSLVTFEDGRAINEGAIHLESLIPKVRLEPTPIAASPR